MKRNAKRLPAQNNQSPAVGLLRAGGLGALLGLSLLFILALLLSFAALKSATPNALVFPIALICMSACGYVGALFGAKKAASCGQNPYLGGLTVFGILFFAVILLSLFFPAAEGRTALHRFAPVGVLLVACLLGSLTAALYRPSRSRQMKKLVSAARR